MDEDHQQSLERRLREMTELVEALRRRETELQNEMQRQAARHEEERRRWHEECGLLQEQRDRLLRRGAASRPSITRLFVSSRTIGGSKQGSGAAHHRPRNFGSLSDGWKQQVLRAIRESGRNNLAFNAQRRSAAAEAADQAARALDTLCISDKQSDKTNSATVASSSLAVWPSESRISPAPGERRIGDLLKRRLLQQQLSLVVHAQNCCGSVTCGVPGCSDTRKALEHMRTCAFVTGCPTTPTCSLTREAVWHYKNCGQDGCEICRAVKRESISTREHLMKFMDAICKDLDEEEASVENRGLPQVVDPPVVAGELISLDIVQPLLHAPILCPIPLPGVETPHQTEDHTDMNVEGVE